jgi:glutathionylspermidine synthase
LKRSSTAPRKDWQRTVERQGLLFHTPDDVTYWDESNYYAFTLDEVDRIARATGRLSEMCIHAVEHVIEKRRYLDLGIPSVAVPLIEDSWERETPAIYDRFDLVFDGTGEPKMLEYNADTPTSLLEAAVIQWFWFEDTKRGSDQYNSLHERLVAKWRSLKRGGHLFAGPVHFATTASSVEDRMTLAYLMDTALRAGLDVVEIDVQEIGFDRSRQEFVDLHDTPMQNVFKLYPWEWMCREDFARHLDSVKRQMHWMEPAWNMVLANKGLLAVLWELYPGDPNLLPAFLDGPRGMRSYAKKPLFSREGGNVTLVRDGAIVDQTHGDYGAEGCVYQALQLLPEFDGMHPVIGSWLVDGEPAGMGIRESRALVTDDRSRFVPHVIV